MTNEKWVQGLGSAATNAVFLNVTRTNNDLENNTHFVTVKSGAAPIIGLSVKMIFTHLMMLKNELR